LIHHRLSVAGYALGLFQLGSATDKHYSLDISMKRFVLTKIFIGSRDEVSISGDSYESANKAFRTVTDIVLMEERFDNLASNFLDFEKEMMTNLIENKYGGFKGGLHQMYVRRNLNRLLVNTMSAARGFVDHLPRACHGVFGQHDARSAECIDKLSASYDSSLGYRIFEALRNHSQHYGFPIQSVSYGTHMDGEFPNLIARNTLSPLTKTDVLKLNKKFKTSTLNEMESLGTPIDLKHYLREYIEELANTHYKFRKLTAPILQDSGAVLNQLVDLFMRSFPESESSTGLHAVTITGDNWLDRVPLSTGMQDYAKYLAECNVHLNRASSGFLATARTDA
jgi:hypothetical protein